MAQQGAGTIRAGELEFKGSFGSYSIKDAASVKDFYAKTLGLAATDDMGGLALKLPGGSKVFLYPKEDHEPATFTVLNLEVDDIDAAVDTLTSRGIKFESYGGDIRTDEKGIFRGSESGNGPNIAWFKDPAGNILSVIEKN